MPNLNIEEFDDAPDIGDKVTVKGKVISIDEESGEVEISYDSVRVGDKKQKRKDRDYDDEDEVDVVTRDEMTVDEALSRSFPQQPGGAIQ